MLFVTIADNKIAASWREGKKLPKTQPESTIGWVLIGWILGLPCFDGAFLWNTSK